MTLLLTKCHDVTQRNITAHHVTLRHTTIYDVTSHDMTSYQVLLRHTTCYYVTLHEMLSYHITKHTMTSHHVIWHHITCHDVKIHRKSSSHHAVWHHINLLRDVMCTTWHAVTTLVMTPHHGMALHQPITWRDVYYVICRQSTRHGVKPRDMTTILDINSTMPDLHILGELPVGYAHFEHLWRHNHMIVRLKNICLIFL